MSDHVRIPLFILCGFLAVMMAGRLFADAIKARSKLERTCEHLLSSSRTIADTTGVLTAQPSCWRVLP